MIKNSFLVIILFVILFFSCSAKKEFVSSVSQVSKETIKTDVHEVLDSWHKAAAEANYSNYFNLMTKDGVFIGTDATENWQNEAFKAFSKPYFDKGKAWHFRAIERNVYVSQDKNTVWFDELLDTQMEICRGSGVLIKENNTWKIAHYVLSISIPNDKVKEVVALKKPNDRELIMKKSIKRTKNN